MDAHPDRVAVLAPTGSELRPVVTVDHVLVVGIAGGLRPEVEIGDLIVPDAGVPAEVFELTGADGEPKVGKSLAFVAEQPQRVPALARLARNAQRAADRAATAAVAACTRR